MNNDLIEQIEGCISMQLNAAPKSEWAEVPIEVLNAIIAALSSVLPEDVQKALEICNYNGYIYYSDRKKLYDLIERLQRENESLKISEENGWAGYRALQETAKKHAKIREEMNNRILTLESMLDRLADPKCMLNPGIGVQDLGLQFEQDRLNRLKYAASHRGKDDDRKTIQP